jgi:hypothetical protein
MKNNLLNNSEKIMQTAINPFSILAARPLIQDAYDTLSRVWSFAHITGLAAALHRDTGLNKRVIAACLDDDQFCFHLIDYRRFKNGYPD